MKNKLIPILVASIIFIGVDVNQTSINFSSAYGQEDNSQRKTKKTGSMTEKVAKKLGEAQELIDAEQLDEGVAVVPGEAFGSSNFFRISFATSNENIEEGCKKIISACKKLK